MIARLDRPTLARLAGLGYSDALIGQRFGLSRRTVARRRAQWQIATTWPPEPSHGTVHRYRALGCRCKPCTAAEAAYSASYRADVQAASLESARWHGEPWEAEEDTYLLEGPGSLLSRSLKLGRTYYAAQRRIQYLRTLAD